MLAPSTFPRSQRLRRWSVALLLLASLGCGAQAEEAAPAGIVTDVVAALPRPFGYMVGDWIEHSVDFTLAPGWRLDEASLPKPGSLDYWLDLLATEVTTTPTPNGARYQVIRRFQTFYFNRETKSLEVPPTVVTLLGEGEKQLFELPGFEFTTSTLHETAGVRRDEDGFYTRPDHVAPRPAPVNSWWGVIGCVLAFLALAGLLPGRFGFGRAAAPFALALRRLRQELASGQGVVSDAAWLALHRAFDATADKSVMQGDLPDFLDQHPRYVNLKPQLEAFFQASSARFFGRDVGPSQWTGHELVNLARQLARLEAIR